MPGIVVYRAEDSCYVKLSATDDGMFEAIRRMQNATGVYIVSSKEKLTQPEMENIERELEIVLQDVNNKPISLKQREKDISNVFLKYSKN